MASERARQAVDSLPALLKIIEQEAGVSDDTDRQPAVVANGDLWADRYIRRGIVPAETAVLQAAVIGPVIARICERGGNQRRVALLVRARRGKGDIAAAEATAGPFDGNAPDIGTQTAGPGVAETVVDPHRAEPRLAVGGNGINHAKRGRIDQLDVAITAIFEVCEEECAVTHDRPTEREAALVALETLPHRIAAEIAARERRACVERAAGADQRIGLTRKIIAARRGGDVDQAVGRAPVGDRVTVGEHRHRAGEAQRHGEFLTAKEILVIVQSIDEIVGVEAVRAVDRNGRCFGEEAGRGHDIGQADQRGDGIACLDRQHGQLAVGEGRRYLGVHRV